METDLAQALNNHKIAIQNFNFAEEEYIDAAIMSLNTAEAKLNRIFKIYKRGECAIG